MESHLQLFIFALIAVAEVRPTPIPLDQEPKPIRLDQQEQKYFQGDIMISGKERNGILKAVRWPEGKIFFEYGENFDQDELDMIKAAMAEIEQNTCIRFYKRTNEASFVQITNGDGCYAIIGHAGGRQSLTLKRKTGPWSSHCFFHRTVVHELLHAVGLFHEQQRKDRDDFVDVYRDNVKKEELYNFDVPVYQDTYGIAYDYTSIMHYDKEAFSKGNLITMGARDPKYTDIIGKAEHGSASDWLMVNRIYDCPSTAGMNPVAISSSGSCTDFNAGCAGWAQSGQCTTNPLWMQPNCYKSCNPDKCSGTGGTGSGCTDNDPRCPGWADRGECSSNPQYMLTTCKKSCKTC